MSSIFWKSITEKHALKIEYDGDAQNRNPREDCDWLGTMNCWHRRYDLGENHSFSEPKDLLRSLAEDFKDTPEGKQVLRKAQREYFKGFKVAKVGDSWQVMHGKGEPYWSYRHWGTKAEAVDNLRDYKVEWLDSAIEEELNFEQLEEIIGPHMVILQLYLYDHSGISMSSQSFIGRAHHADWDSGPVGFIYCTKERFREETGYNEDELFSTDEKRKPKVGDHVKVKGYEHHSWYGKIESIKGGKAVVNFDHNKSPEFRNPENVVTVHLSDISELMTNYAEQMLKSEVDTYDEYLRGEVYGFTLYKVLREELDKHMKENKLTVDEMDWDELEEFLEETESCWGFYGDDHTKSGLKEHLPDEDADALLKNMEQGEIREQTTYHYS